MLVVAQQEQLPVAQAKAGEPEAWNVLFKRYQLPLYVYVFELVGEEQASLDIVQETFISAARNISGLRENGKFGGWLFGIAHQRCIHLWRKRHTRGEEPLSDELAQGLYIEDDGPSDLLIRHEQEAQFMKLLNQLPLPQRSVLLLYFVEDFSIEEIADVTHTQAGTVKSRLFYAKKALKKLVEENAV